ncbi:protein kinase domain-containing protein [Streptomyces spongiae]|uniref:Protein kinase n=1 Tax=Streptomyces spongiae TaxID=565072 RepID=A0A5N8XI64_9ACTN|nr:protein kinase [Streptomyces spongiae]MPY59171.1 protein kinase [Streptomyces spongiae]
MEPAPVKVIKSSTVDSTARLHFAQEIETLKTIWGARIAHLLDADADTEQPWLATEYVEGSDLGRFVTTHGPLSSVLVLALGATLAEGLAHVHRQGLLHRDLKPANILLGPNGTRAVRPSQLMEFAMYHAADLPFRCPLTRHGRGEGVIIPGANLVDVAYCRINRPALELHGHQQART